MSSPIEEISAVTCRVENMNQSARFYRDVVGMELLYGGQGVGFSSLHARKPQSAILNLQQGEAVTQWGRLIFYLTDVDALWNHLRARGFDPQIPRDGSWAERFSIGSIRMDTICPLRGHCNGIRQTWSRSRSKGASCGGVMAYYKVRIEVWCDWDPKESSLEEIVENISAGEAIWTSVEVIAVADRPQDIEDDQAMSFFGGEEGDADQSQG